MANYLGKPALKISSQFEHFASMSDLAFRALPPIQNMLDHPELNSVIDNKELTTFLIAKAARTSLLSFYSINKAYNSDKYTDHYLHGRDLLSKDFGSKKAKLAFNGASAVPLSDYQFWLSQINGVLAFADPKTYLENIAKDCLEFVLAKYEAFKANVQGTEKPSATLKWALWELKKAADAVSSGKTQNTRSLPVVAPISGGTIADLIASISSMIVQFLSGSLISQTFINILSWATTAVASKLLGIGAIAKGCYYVCASILHSIQASLPVIFNPTGLFAGAFNFLMAYAPLIIVGAIITYLIIKHHKRELGEYFYVIGKINIADENPACFAFAKLHSVSTFLEIESYLEDFGDKCYKESEVTLNVLWGFCCDKDKPVLAMDFIKEETYRIEEEVLTKFAPFAGIINSDRPWYLT